MKRATLYKYTCPECGVIKSAITAREILIEKYDISCCAGILSFQTKPEASLKRRENK